MSFADVDDKVVEAVVIRREFWRLMPFLLGACLWRRLGWTGG